MATTGAGTPYVEPDDELVTFPATSLALAQRLDSSPGYRAVAVRQAVTADANGNASVSHSLGVSPDWHLFDVSAPDSGNLVAADVKVRATTSTGVTVRVFRADGTPFAGNVTVFGLLGRVSPSVTALPAGAL